jgi:chromosome partitioning protein
VARPSVRCAVCDRAFTPRFSYQRDPDSDRHYCSLACRTPELEHDTPQRCSHCDKTFDVRFAYQVITQRNERRIVCSKGCRVAALAAMSRGASKQARVLAVVNQKGGTGKTTTSVSLATGLARRGRRVLLVDLDAQGSAGLSLGARGSRTIEHVLLEECSAKEAIVAARRDVDVLLAAESLVEAKRIESKDRTQHLRRALRPVLGTYDDVILDCAPSLSVLVQSALLAATEVLIPISCDYLALVGVKQILRTLHHVETVLLHPVVIAGVVPTFFDKRSRISGQVVEALIGHFGALVTPPIRINARLREAPSHNKSIFEYAPDSPGAEDYAALVDRLLGASPAKVEVAAPAAPSQTLPFALDTADLGDLPRGY